MNSGGKRSLRVEESCPTFMKVGPAGGMEGAVSGVEGGDSLESQQS